MAVAAAACATHFFAEVLLSAYLLPDGVVRPDIPGTPECCDAATMRVQIQRGVNENNSLALINTAENGVTKLQVRQGMEWLYSNLGTHSDAQWISSRDYLLIRAAIIKMSQRLGGVQCGMIPNQTFMQEMIKLGDRSFRLDLECSRVHNLRS